jgi:RNA polymerase sigma factor (sigma-70 family)
MKAKKNDWKNDSISLTETDESKLSFSVLYETYFQKLFEYGCRLNKDEYLVQDCIQDTFIKLWKNRSNISKISNIKSYLLIALKNNIISKSSTSYTNIDTSENYSFELSYSIISEDSKYEASVEKLNELYMALNALTARQKECLYLRYFVGLRYEDISELLNISTKATYKLNARALEYLKANLSSSVFILFGIFLSNNIDYISKKILHQ